jgi:prepilin-type N-terminal cleavage/methylation domain-containing protein
MKRLAPRSGFTLIEMITVVAIIILLAGLVISTAGWANRKAAMERALNEIKGIGAAIENYKIDNGTVPQNNDTDLLDPRIHFSAIGGTSGTYYNKASRYLYQALTGDLDPPNDPDGKPETGNKSYYTFDRSLLNVSRNGTGEITKVHYIQDPFGNSYGYSTAGLNLETEYRRSCEATHRRLALRTKRASTLRRTTCGRRPVPRRRTDSEVGEELGSVEAVGFT